MPVPEEVREAICAEIEEALRSISVGEDADGMSYGILDAIAEARHETDLKGAGDILRDASADILDAALSALEAAGWEVNRKGTREALERSSHAMKKLIREGVDRGKGHWPAWDECALVVDHAVALLSASNPKEQAP